MTREFIKAGELLIPIRDVENADISGLEEGCVHITYAGGKKIEARGFDALEAVMALNPSAAEGRGLRWIKNAWAMHNLVAHPLMQIMVWLGFRKQALWLHDVTVPKPVGTKAS